MMKNLEIASCYCFNPSCGQSIFKLEKNITVFHPLEKVMSGHLHCSECNADLVSKPILEMKKEIYNAVLKTDTVQHIMVSSDRILVTL